MTRRSIAWGASGPSGAGALRRTPARGECRRRSARGSRRSSATPARTRTARAYSADDVTVHLQGCAHCPFDADHGRGGPEPSGANDRWHRLGIHESPCEAMREARVRVPKGIVFRCCGHCLRGEDEDWDRDRRIARSTPGESSTHRRDGMRVSDTSATSPGTGRPAAFAARRTNAARCRGARSTGTSSGRSRRREPGVFNPCRAAARAVVEHLERRRVTCRRKPPPPLHGSSRGVGDGDGNERPAKDRAPSPAPAQGSRAVSDARWSRVTNSGTSRRRCYARAATPDTSPRGWVAALAKERRCSARR